MEMIVSPRTGISTDRAGGKGAALASLSESGILIPPWIAITPEAFKQSLGEEQAQALADATQFIDAQSILENIRIEPELIEASQEYIDRICPNGERLAVRSSAIEEDGKSHSFAGLLESFLSVTHDQVPTKIIEVWRSAYSRRVFEYRERMGLSLPPPPPAVILQRMLDPQAAGIAFSRDPVNPENGRSVISAVSGLGDQLASGESNADTWYVDANGEIIQRRLTDGKKAVLSDTDIISIAELARRTESHFSCPQDIEWAFQDGKLYLLQARPITALETDQEQAPSRTIWDNSNIGESYNGITTPLTFSFAGRAYRAVYRQFCLTLGVSKRIVDDNQEAFDNLLGLIRGRIYYNLNSWYRILSLLPGFSINQQFMEQMMGVDQSLPEDVRIRKPAASRMIKLREGFSLFTAAIGLVLHHFMLPLTRARFLKRLDRSLAEAHNIPNLSTKALGAYYRELERQLLTRWDAPLINDFFAMIFVGMLRKLTLAWGEADNPSLHNDLLSGEPDIISVEPVRRIRTMAELARADVRIVELLDTAPLDVIETELPNHPELCAQIRRYLDDFGYRCLHELKLESPTLHDNPITLYRAVGRLASREVNTPVDTDNRRQTAENQMSVALNGRGLRKLIFSWVLRNARARTRDRENLRFERTRVFGTARRIFVALGQRFHEQGLLVSPQDIFYLQVEEILGMVEETPTPEVIIQRRNEFNGFRELPIPPNRFETLDASGTERIFPSVASVTPAVDSQTLQGEGAASGIVRGKVRVISDPENASLEPGEILVAERTDPGWIMLFSAASGVLIEHGSLLSHVSIVTRELRIPAIVALPGLTQWLKDGDWIEMDGSSGTVNRVSLSD